MWLRISKILKNKFFWIGLFGVIVIAGGGYYYYSTRNSSANGTTDEPKMQTAIARRGELVLMASGTGSLIPASEISLGFEESGSLIELNIQVGDKVKVGQVLARLQTSDTAEDIAATIAEAELNVIKAQNALEELYANADIARTDALNNIAVYAQASRDAQYQMDYYTLPSYLQGMDSIQALDQMKAELDAAVQAFDPYKYLSENNDTRQELLEKLSEAQSRYDAAVQRLNYEYELQVAQANLEKARQVYDQFKDGPAKDELAEAEAELANAKANLTLAQKDKPTLDLTAPIEGTIMEIAADIGESLSASTFITIADLDHPMLEVYLDESDLDKVAVGYQAQIVFDALPNQTFDGKVTVVSPGLEDVSNVKAIKVLVLLDTTSLKSPTFLLIGLNAAVDIIASKTENAVLVPVEAIRELGPNEYTVFVLENGGLVMRVVQVGLMDITSAEIISGLEAGEVVSTGIVQTE